MRKETFTIICDRCGEEIDYLKTPYAEIITRGINGASDLGQLEFCDPCADVVAAIFHEHILKPDRS